MSGCIHFYNWDNKCHACMSAELTTIRERVAALEAALQKAISSVSVAHTANRLLLEDRVALSAKVTAETQRADAAEVATVEAIAAWIGRADEWGAEAIRHGYWRK